VIKSPIGNRGRYIEMIGRTLGFVATACCRPIPGGVDGMNGEKELSVIMPDGRAIQISAGNPND
jgi:hypothetical protein